MGTHLRAPQKPCRSLAKDALASLLRRSTALSLSKLLDTATSKAAFASSIGAVLDSLLFENRLFFFLAHALMTAPE